MDRIWLEERPVRLEARFHHATEKTVGTVVICHAHPQYGGSMHNNVVAAVSQAASRSDFAWLKFNFRGVGGSEGSFDGGVGEMDDVRNALSYLGERGEGGSSTVLAGYSFGAYVASRVAVESGSANAFIGVGIPLTVYSMDHMEAMRIPILLVVGEADPFCPVEPLTRWTKERLPSARLEIVKGTDHFFVGYEKQLSDAIVPFLEELA